MDIFTYYPSTKNQLLAQHDVILVAVMIMSDKSVLLKKEDTDMIFLYPGALYGFRVKQIK